MEPVPEGNLRPAPLQLGTAGATSCNGASEKQARGEAGAVRMSPVETAPAAAPASNGSLEGRLVDYAGRGSAESGLSRMTSSTDSNTDGAALLERTVEIEQAGLAGSRPTAIWCGNIPEASNSESAIRVLFGQFGQIRRVFVRRKCNPNRSWCLITYRSSASVHAALAASIVVKDANGADVELAVELPAVKEELSKPKPGALGSVVAMVLEEYQQNPSPRANDAAVPDPSPQTSDGSPPTRQRRRSAVELEIRNSLAAEQASESSSALTPDQSKTRSMWQKLRTTSFRNKLAVTAMFVQNDDENEKAAKQAIKQTLHTVRQEEVAITMKLKGFAQLHNGEMCGLDYRFKTEASLFRKVMARVDKATAEAAVSKTAPPTSADILKTILDILRYTVVFPTNRYTSSVREMIHALKEHDYKQHRVKNYWGPGDGYQGINSVFVSPTGQAFELQFHTPESLSMKEEECHSSYAKFRTAKDSRKMMQFWEEMVSMWDMVPVPEGVLEIPQVVQQKLEFDLSRLSEEETAAIQYRKSLEHVCRYHVDELHSRAVKAEAEIGALMVYLMHKHAPGRTCDQKEKRSAVRAQLSMLRQLVDSFIQSDQPEEEAEPNSDDGEVDSNTHADSGAASPVSDSDDSVRTTSSQRRRAATLSDQSFGKISVGVKVEHQRRIASVDFKETNKTEGMSKSMDKAMPDEGSVRDRLRELELEFPPLKYKIVCCNEQLYSTIVHGFLRDIANDSDYEVYAVNNWWDDLEKFGAINARFVAVRHGLRFEVTFHTEASWDASIEHSEYMRRKFDTVIKTDVLFTDNPRMVDQVKTQMRREEMWRERWARINVPDRALTIGTLRYAHICAPDPKVLESQAHGAVGRSHRAINRFHQAGNLVKSIVRMRSTHHSSSGTHGSSSMAATGYHVDDAAKIDLHSSSDQVGGAWAEMVGAFFEEHKDIAQLFDKFKAAYVADRGSDFAAWQPLASRFAALEHQMARIQATVECKSTVMSTNAEGTTFDPPTPPDLALASAERSVGVQNDITGRLNSQLCTGGQAKVAVAECSGASTEARTSSPAGEARSSAGTVAAPLPAGLRATAHDRAEVLTAAPAPREPVAPPIVPDKESSLSDMIEKLLRNQETIARLAGHDAQ